MNRNQQQMYKDISDLTKALTKLVKVIEKCKTLWILPPSIPNKEFVQPPQCMPDEYKDTCSIKAYWNYYIGEKYVVANINKEKIYKQIPGTVTTAH